MPTVTRSLELEVGNSWEVAHKEGFVNWTLFVRAPAGGSSGGSLANLVKRVTVTLHPSFKNNVLVLDEAPFELTRCGWGTFDVLIRVEAYTDSKCRRTTDVCVTHCLSFQPGGASRTIVLQVPDEDAVAAVADAAAAVAANAAAKTAEVAAAAAAAAAATAAAVAAAAERAAAETAAAESAAGAAVATLYDDLAAEVPGGSAKLSVVWRAMHGRSGDPTWAAPVKVVHCDQDARPGYATRKAHEYNDTLVVLRAKVRLLAEMVRKSKHAAAYTGAGISTASGIGDYASKAKNTTCGKADAKKKNKQQKKSGLDAEPTFAHRVLTGLHAAGFLKHWVQQNHDGLPQKAGFPQAQLNEIHGAWQDPSNPVVPMDGHLRRDLIDWLSEEEDKADLCLVLGTSMCGMAADDFALTINKRAQAARNRLGGMVVVSLQQTQHDHRAALRIFAKIDHVMALLAHELETDGLVVLPFQPSQPLQLPAHSVFEVAYDAKGDPTVSSSAASSSTSTKTKTATKQQQQHQQMQLDLRPGAEVRVTRGVGRGFVGVVRGVKANGDFLLALPVIRENDPQHGKGTALYTLGRWWVKDALDGVAKYLPVVNVEPVFSTAAGAVGGAGSGGSGGGIGATAGAAAPH